MLRSAVNDHAQHPATAQAFADMAMWCAQADEAEPLFQHVLTRLQAAHAQLRIFCDTTNDTVEHERCVEAFDKEMATFSSALERYCGAPFVARVLQHKKLIKALKEIHAGPQTSSTGLRRLFLLLKVEEESGSEWEYRFQDAVAAFEKAVADEVNVYEMENVYRANPTMAMEAVTLLRNAEERADKFEWMHNAPANALSNMLKTLEDYDNVTLPVWFIPESEIHYKKRAFACGSLGTDHFGSWRSNTNVIVKFLRVGTPHEQLNARLRITFLKEADLWVRLSHPYLLKLFGACHVASLPFFVCEEATGGNLSDVLKRDMSRMWRLLFQSALAIEYLRSKNIVHGDLKLSNILVTKEGYARVADFGLRRFKKSSRDRMMLDGPYLEGAGALRWCAPEALEHRPQFQSDVYSFAMCIIEAIGGRIPYYDVEDGNRVMDKIKNGELPERPEEMDDEIWEFVLKMTKINLRDRPMIKDVIRFLKTKRTAEYDDEHERNTIKGLCPDCDATLLKDESTICKRCQRNVKEVGRIMSKKDPPAVIELLMHSNPAQLSPAATRMLFKPHEPFPDMDDEEKKQSGGRLLMASKANDVVTVRDVLARSVDVDSRIEPSASRTEVTTPAPPTTIRENRLFLGSAGTGKTTLINCLVGAVQFPSGPRVFGALTHDYQRVDHAGVAYMDTPGLTGTAISVQAAEAITKALRQGGTYKLLFLVRLRDGHVASEDLVILERVLDAIDIAAANISFSVIFNNVDKKQYAILRQPGSNAFSAVRGAVNQHRFKTDAFYFIPKIAALDGASDAVVTLPQDVRDYIDGVAPVMSINPRVVRPVQAIIGETCMIVSLMRRSRSSENKSADKATSNTRQSDEASTPAEHTGLALMQAQQAPISMSKTPTIAIHYMSAFGLPQDVRDYIDGVAPVMSINPRVVRPVQAIIGDTSMIVSLLRRSRSSENKSADKAASNIRQSDEASAPAEHTKWAHMRAFLENDVKSWTAGFLQSRASHNRPFEIPVDVINRGATSTEAFIDVTLGRLWAASKANDVATVREVLERNANVDIRDEMSGRTALHEASSKGFVQIVELLLKANADPNAVDNEQNKKSALHMASEGGHVPVIKLLLKAKGDPNAVDKVGQTPLHVACAFRTGKAVRVLLAAKADHNIKDNDNREPLHLCIRSIEQDAQVDITVLATVQVLVAGGATWDTKCDEEVDELMAQDEPVNAAPALRLCLLLWAQQHAEGVSFTEIPLEVINRGATTTQTFIDMKLRRLLTASKANDVAAVREMLASNMDVDSRDEVNGRTALHEASSRGHRQIVELVLEADADPNPADKYGETPLHMASCEGHVQVVELLLNSNGNLNAVDKFGHTPLHFACAFHASNIVRTLLAAGANFHFRDNGGREPLHMCIRSLEHAHVSKKTMLTLQALVASGATWDATCDHLIAEGQARPETSALRLCTLLWAQEHTDGFSFTDVPMEVIKRGAPSTKAYLDSIKSSRDIVLRRKICLVGSSCAGKTSFVKSITSELLEPQLEHFDDRTIGIDHFPLRVLEPVAGRSDSKIHEVTFWDFAGQDAYQVAHSLFFSPRTMFLVFVDIEAFAIAYMQAAIFADQDSQETKLLDEFVERAIKHWIRMVLTRQPEAEIVFIATKDDSMSENAVMERIVKDELNRKLHGVHALIKEMKIKLAEQQETVSVDKLSDMITIEPRVVFVSCTSSDSIQTARSTVEELIIQSKMSIPMPDKYSQVLKAIVKIREEAKTLDITKRIGHVFAAVDTLPEKLQIDQEMCHIILQTLHDLGDVLWYEDLDVDLFQKTVILDPLLMIDFIRQVITHKHTGQILSHPDLKGKPFWMDLPTDDTTLMEAMKKLLQHFHLVYSAAKDRVMRWDSYLIVPAYWQTKTPASWKFLGGKLLVRAPKDKPYGERVRVRWEYHFEHWLPPQLFDQFVVASVSQLVTLDAGPDWILYEGDEEYTACRLMVDRDRRSLHQTIRVEAVVSDAASEK